MPTFLYRATHATGREETGTISASTLEQARTLLVQRGLLAVSLVLDKSSQPALLNSPSLMTDLRILAEESYRPRLRSALRQMVDELERGRPVEQVLGRLPAAFPQHVSSLINAGIDSGKLPILAEQALNHLQRESEQRRQVIWSLSYVGLLLLVSSIILTGILLVIVPYQKQLFTDFGTSLPALTVAVIELSDLCLAIVSAITSLAVHYGWLGSMLLLVIFAGLVSAMLKTIRRSAAGKRLRWYRQWFVRGLPLIGPFFRSVSLSNVLGLSAGLIRAEMSLPRALRLAAAANDDRILADGVEKIARHVEQGESMFVAAVASESFPSEVLPVFRWADNPTLFADSLQEAAQMYAMRSRLQFTVMMVLLEPLIIASVGFLVGMLVVAMFAPLIQLLNVLS